MHAGRPPLEPEDAIGDNACTSSIDFSRRLKDLGQTWARKWAKLPPQHPLKVAARTYAVSLSLSLAPTLLPILRSRSKPSRKAARTVKALQNELSPKGFAFAMTVAIGGAVALDALWQELDVKWRDCGNVSLERCVKRPRKWSKIAALSSAYKTFFSSSISSLAAILLLQSRRSPSRAKQADIPFTSPIQTNTGGRIPPTLDLTLIILVRALDTVLQGVFALWADAQLDHRRKGEEITTSHLHDIRAKAAKMTDKLDAILFWAASSRIMWCFFYQRESLGCLAAMLSDLRRIGALANVDNRIIDLLQQRRAGTWTYGERLSNPLLMTLATDLSYPTSWGDSRILPARGGTGANQVWKSIGVTSRPGVGGVPCELVHGNVGGIFGNIGASCSKNVAIRGLMGFAQAFAIYAPVHFLPILLSRPRSLTKLATIKRLFTSVSRSSLFLSAFISSIWAFVCMTRTSVLARLIPSISHNFLDGPFGCILAGCLACGSSIWIEEGRRRGEMALYVLPRALRTLLQNSWLRSGSFNVKIIERLTFMLSLATILTAARHKPECLRGLSHWTLSFILDGLGADFLKNRKMSR